MFSDATPETTIEMVSLTKNKKKYLQSRNLLKKNNYNNNNSKTKFRKLERIESFSKKYLQNNILLKKK